MKFTYQNLYELHQVIKKNDYHYVFFDEQNSHERTVILRHDVDFSLEKAKQLAIFESKIEVKSTYFFLLSSPFYNLNTPYAKNLINFIQANGHEIGLHFDEALYPFISLNDLVRNIQNEVSYLSLIINRPIKYVSMHRPSKNVLETDLQLNQVINTYSKKFFSEYGYISDSRRFWKTDPFQFFNSKKQSKIQLLTHPIWYNEIELSLKESLKSFVKGKFAEIIEGMNSNFTNLQEAIDFEEFKL
jgi:hypothetical protein